MKNLIAVLAVITGCLFLTMTNVSYVMCGSYDVPQGHKHTKEGEVVMTTFEKIAKEAELKGGVKEISYEQFIVLRNAKEPYILLDVLAPDSYRAGHIEGAVSFPVDTINEETVQQLIPKDSNIVVYCGSFSCEKSASAAKKLGEFGYNVLDYRGGLKEWREKGNKLVK